MGLNSHFKRIILSSLLSSPAWVWLLDSVLELMAKGYTFLYKFPLFLGKDNRTGSPISTLPSPVGDYGFNPVWLDFPAVKQLLDNQGFSDDFTTSLEMLPTGLGRLNCTSPYMFFKVLNALHPSIPRSRFSFLGASFHPMSNERRIDYFLELTGDLEDNTYTYRSLSPLRDGDLLLHVDSNVSVDIDSYSKEFIVTSSPLPLGFYSIYRRDALFPIPDGVESLYLWTYPQVPTQLVYDRYSPIHVYGTALQQTDLGVITVRCKVAPLALKQTYWLIFTHVLTPAFANGLTPAILDQISISPTSYKYDMSNWIPAGKPLGVVRDFVILTKWVSFPTEDYHINAFMLEVSEFSFLFDKGIDDNILYTEKTSPSGMVFDKPVYTETDAVLCSRIYLSVMGDVDTEVISLFDTRMNYSFGFNSAYRTFFKWNASTKTGSFGGDSFTGSLPTITSMRMVIKDCVVTVFLDGVLRFTFSAVQPTDTFVGFGENKVYYFRYGLDYAYATPTGAMFKGVVDPSLSYTPSIIPVASMLAFPFRNPKTNIVCGTNYKLFLPDYKVPLYVEDKFDVSWDLDMNFKWAVSLNNIDV